MLRFTDNVIGQMTLQCNLNCKYCYEGTKLKQQKEFLTVENFKEALDSYLYQHCVLGDLENRANWHFHGGEPLLYNWEDLKECIRYVKRRQQKFPNLTWCIQTNGTLITDEIAEFFAKEHATIGFSFDGFSTENRMSQDQNIKLINRLEDFHKKYGTRFNCLTVLSKDNVKTWFTDMQRISSWCAECGVNILCPVDALDSQKLSGADCWEYWVKPCLESYLTDSPVRERLVTMMIETYLSWDVLVTNQTDPFKTGCFDRVCGHGVNMTSIDPDMTASNCDKFLEEGNFPGIRQKYPLDERDFLGLQQVKRYIAYLQTLFKVETATGCDNCYAKNLCIGDCQSVNLSKYGEIRLDTDMCQIYKQTYDFLKLHWIEILEKHPMQVLFEIRGLTPTALRELDDFGYSPMIDSLTSTISTKKRIKNI